MVIQSVLSSLSFALIFERVSGVASFLRGRIFVLEFLRASSQLAQIQRTESGDRQFTESEPGDRHLAEPVPAIGVTSGFLRVSEERYPSGTRYVSLEPVTISSQARIGLGSETKDG